MAFLLALCAAGVVSIDSAPGSAGLIGLRARSAAPASGSGASSACPGPPDGVAAGEAAIKATVAGSAARDGRAGSGGGGHRHLLRRDGGMARTRRGGRGELRGAGDGAERQQHHPGGHQGTSLMTGHRIPTEHSSPRSWGRESPRVRVGVLVPGEGVELPRGRGRNVVGRAGRRLFGWPAPSA